MKSYTDLEQSKVLSKILSLESADMFLALNGTLPVMSKYIDDGFVTADDTAVPCWSLAALYNILPLPCEIHKQADDDSIYYYVEYTDKDKYLYTERHKNSVDACVEMIIKLYEINLL